MPQPLPPLHDGKTCPVCKALDDMSGVTHDCKGSMPQPLTREEIDYLVALVRSDKKSFSFMRGFRKPTQEEQEESAIFNRLIEKLQANDCVHVAAPTQ